MKTPGILRKVDELGRVVIPSELRKAMKLETGDLLSLTLEEESLVLRKFTPGCIFCGGIEGLVSFEGKLVCGNCRNTLKRI